MAKITPLLACVYLGIVGVRAAVPASAPEFSTTSPIKAQFFDVAQVRLLPGHFKDAQERDRAYLQSLDPDRLLLMFRVTAGLPSRAQALGGWEAPGFETRGHTLGQYLSACSLMVAATGDEQLRKNVDYIVRQLAQCQAAMPAQGFHPGYLSAFPETFFDRVDARERVRVPWYTMHKIMAGLLDAHVHTGNAQALVVLEQLANWVKFRVDRLTPQQMQASLETEHGGMTEVLANLAAVTHNPEYLRLSAAFNHHAVFDPLAHGIDKLDGLHANTQIPKITGVAREYELTGKPEYHAIATFFWQDVALHRSYALGGDSDREHFFPITDFAQHLTWRTAETCNTYNMLKLTKHIWAWDPEVSTMDFYERGLYNQILASQDPKTGMFTYFISLKPGHFKTYSTPDSFWCCVGTGMENHAKYGGAIYAHSADALWVNLYIASELKWAGRGITIRQETAFPLEPRTKLTVATAQPARFALKLREPRWASQPIACTVNGTNVATTADASGYVTIDREWTNGDVIQVSLPMSLRTEPLPGNPNTVAVFYGPVLLAGELGREGMPRDGAYSVLQNHFAGVADPAVPMLAGAGQAVLDGIKPVAGQPLTFEAAALARDDAHQSVRLVPFYDVHDQRYTVYWQTRR